MMQHFTKKSILRTFIAIVVITLYAAKVSAQVTIPFTPRTSEQAPEPYKNQTNYHLQGDFTMIGNTNLTLRSYSNNGGNNADMIYVDVDQDPYTANSSSATLIIPDEACTEIVYAGLYWTGRAHNTTSSSMSFNVTNQDYLLNPVNKNVTHRHNELEDPYTLTISREGSGGNRYPQYRLQAPGQDLIEFQLTNSISLTNRLQYRINGGNWTNVRLSSYNTTTGVAVLRDPLVINQGTHTLTFTEVGRNPVTNGNNRAYRNANNYLKYSIVGDIEVWQEFTVPLHKRKVQFKKAGEAYQEVTAGNMDISYPSGASDNMYAAYADVTDYVRNNGSGEYFVGNIALNEGNGGSVGYYGGWGMVVIYQNTSMKWRDITVFDGYGYMSKEVGSAILNVSGFQAAQHGEVQIRLGMMAGEGDRGISGDYFRIKQRNSGAYDNLSHGGNATNNFFNSSIFTGGNPRNPNLLNNTGLDISMFELDNPNNMYIDNGQTTTSFQFGSNQDVYSIFNITFAVDAYTTEVIGENAPVAVGGTTPITGGVLDPSQELEFLLDIYNTGEEAILNTKVEIPVPYNLHFVSATPTSGFPLLGTVSWSHPSGATDPSLTPGGLITWDLGELPEDPTRNEILAQLRYRFKVTDDCTLLTTSVGSCGLEITINGTITGTGKVSGLPLDTGLAQDNSLGGCVGYNYNDFTSTIEIGSEFISNCHAVENGVKQFKVYCELSGVVERDFVVADYPLGTKFFDTPPSSYETTTGVVTGDFTIPTSSGITTFYAISPGMPPNCYMLLEINNLKVDSVPEVEDVSFCEVEEVVLSVALSSEGVSLGYHLIYYDSNDNVLPNPPSPTTVGVHTYKVAEGVILNGVECIGEKVTFTVEITEAPITSFPLEDVRVCENSDFTLEVVPPDNNFSYSWEYKINEIANTWQPLTNATYPNVLTVGNTTLELHHATPAVDRVVVRLKADEGNCEILSYEFQIEVRACKAIINPVLAN